MIVSMQTQPLPINTAFKFIERRKNEWRCLLCCHVRTGTIFLGLWHLMLQLLTLSTFVVFLKHPEFFRTNATEFFITEHNDLPTALAERNMPTLNMNSFATDNVGLSSNDPSDIHEPVVDDLKNDEYYSSYGMFTNRPLHYGRLNCAIFMLFCIVFITITMIYGAIKGKPKMLLPFFCLQLFDLFVTILSALGYICYLSEFQRAMVQAKSDYKLHSIDNLVQINPQLLFLIVAFSLIVSIISKGYFVGVVWSCYRYLTLKLTSAQPTIHYIESNFAVQNLLRPDYDFNMKKFPPPPPSYAVAVGEDHATIPDVPPPSYNSN